MATVTLLLIGREGNGKSSTGNSILNKKVFNPRTISTAGSDDIIVNSNVIDGKKVVVLDGLSLRDTSVDGKDNVMAMIRLAEKAVSNAGNGITALIICLKYGTRFTAQERSALSIIRSLFGAHVLQNYAVIVMTHGDNFANDMEEERKTFEVWCQEQTGDIQDLFKECGGRFLLFNNRTNSEKEKNEQVKRLMSKVEKIQYSSAPYSLDNFRQAKPGQIKLLVLSKLPELQKQTSSLLDYITQNLRKLDDSYYSPSNYLSELDKLKQEIDNHKSFLQREDDGTNCVGQIMLQISVTEASISTKRERHLRKIELEEQISRGRTSPTPTSTKFKPLSPKVKILLLIIAAIILFIIIMVMFF